MVFREYYDFNMGERGKSLDPFPLVGLETADIKAHEVEAAYRGLRKSLTRGS